MAVPTFDRAVSAIHLAHEVQSGSPMHALVGRARTAMDEEPEVIYSVEGGHVIQGASEAVFFGDDGEVSVTDIDEGTVDEDVILLLGGLGVAVASAIASKFAIGAKRTIEQAIRLHKDGKMSAAEKALAKLSTGDRRKFEALVTAQTKQIKRMNKRNEGLGEAILEHQLSMGRRMNACTAAIAEGLSVEPLDEARISTKDPMTMTAGAINKELDRLDAAMSKHMDAMIAAGRGRERFSEIAKASDPLSKDIIAVSTRQSALRDEAKARYGPKLIGKLPTGKGYGPRKKNESEEEGGRNLDEAGIKPHRFKGPAASGDSEQRNKMARKKAAADVKSKSATRRHAGRKALAAYEAEEIEDEEGLDLVEHEVLVILDCEDLIAEAIEDADPKLVAEHAELIAEFESCVEEGDYERAETITEMLCEALQLDEYKRMTTGARMKRLRARRTGMTQAVKTGKKSRTEVRKENRINRRMMKRSPSKRLARKRYRRRTRHHRARVRPLAQARESFEREVETILGDLQLVEKVGVEAVEVMRINTRPKHPDHGNSPVPAPVEYVTYMIYDDGTVARDRYADGRNQRAVLGKVSGLKPKIDALKKLVRSKVIGDDSTITYDLSMTEDMEENRFQPSPEAKAKADALRKLAAERKRVKAALARKKRKAKRESVDEDRNAHGVEFDERSLLVMWEEEDEATRGTFEEWRALHFTRDLEEGVYRVNSLAELEAAARKLPKAPHPGPDSAFAKLFVGEFGLEEALQGVLDEKAPPGFKGTVKAMKADGMSDDKAYALAWSMYKKGHKSHRKADGSRKDEGYSSLNDAAQLDEGYAAGDTEIWYRKPGAADDGPLEETHVLVGSISESRPETVLGLMQGSRWSPNGEARTLISQLGLRHTSMGIGDVVKVGDAAYTCDHMGFTKLR